MQPKPRTGWGSARVVLITLSACASETAPTIAETGQSLCANDSGTGTGVFISEVMDHKTDEALEYVELFNASTSPVNLDHYTLRRYQEGASASGPLSGTIGARRTFVIVQTAGKDKFIERYSAAANMDSAVVNGDGTGAYELHHNSTGLVDVYGDKNANGVNTSWDYRERLARRRPRLTNGSLCFDVSQWTIEPSEEGVSPVIQNGDPLNHVRPYISEVADHPTDSGIQFVELCNPAGYPVDLTGYGVRRGHDTSTTAFDQIAWQPVNPPTPPNPQIPPGGTFVIASVSSSSSFKAEYGIAPDAETAAGAADGNDLIELLFNTAATDRFGPRNLITPGDWMHPGATQARRSRFTHGAAIFSNSTWTTTWPQSWVKTAGPGAPGFAACGDAYAAVAATGQRLCWDPVSHQPAPCPVRGQPRQCYYPSLAQSAPCPTETNGVCRDGSNQVVPCPGKGQDGHLMAGVKFPTPRFKDNNNGTITDNLTGLIWLRNASCLGKHKWPEAVVEVDKVGRIGSDNKPKCGVDPSLEGQWRLPTVKELLSLIDYNYFGPALSNAAGTLPHPATSSNTCKPCANGGCGPVNGGCVTPCPSECVFLGLEGEYWSLTTGVGLDGSNNDTDAGPTVDGEKAWAVKLGEGSARGAYKFRDSQAPLSVLAVMKQATTKDSPASVQATGQTTCWTGAPLTETPCSMAVGQEHAVTAGVRYPGERFTDNADGNTVTDHLTGLIWMKDAICFPEMSWAEALNAAKNPSACGLTGSDWRLPNIKEIQSLIDYGTAHYPNDPPLPPTHKFITHKNRQSYWSSTTVASNAVANNSTKAWWFIQPSGLVDYSNTQNPQSKDNARGVWLVKGPRTLVP